MTTKTAIDLVGVDRILAKLAGLIPPASVARFEEPDTPPLGDGAVGFDAARWLDEVIVDRRLALVRELRELSATFDELASRLRYIRSEIATADAAAAATLASVQPRELP